MICPACGSAIPDSASFCTNCGASLKDVETTPAPAPVEEPAYTSASAEESVTYTSASAEEPTYTSASTEEPTYTYARPDYSEYTYTTPGSTASSTSGTETWPPAGYSTVSSADSTTESWPPAGYSTVSSTSSTSGYTPSHSAGSSEGAKGLIPAIIAVVLLVPSIILTFTFILTPVAIILTAIAFILCIVAIAKASSAKKAGNTAGGTGVAKVMGIIGLIAAILGLLTEVVVLFILIFAGLTSSVVQEVETNLPESNSIIELVNGVTGSELVESGSGDAEPAAPAPSAPLYDFSNTQLIGMDEVGFLTVPAEWSDYSYEYDESGATVCYVADGSEETPYIETVVTISGYYMDYQELADELYDMDINDPEFVNVSRRDVTVNGCPAVEISYEYADDGKPVREYAIEYADGESTYVYVEALAADMDEVLTVLNSFTK